MRCLNLSKKLSAGVLAALATVMTLATVSAQAGLVDRIGTSDLSTQEGRVVNFGNQFFTGRDLVPGDSITNLLRYSFPATAARPDETVYVGRARYSLNADSSILNRAFFLNIQAFGYLLGPSNKLSLISSNPYRLACKKSVMLGISVESQQTIRVVEQSELRTDAALNALVRSLNTHNVLPDRVVIQSFNNFSDYFDVGVMMTMIYNDGPGRTSVDLVSLSLIHTVPPLIGRSFISNTSKSDLFYYVDHLSYWENRR